MAALDRAVALAEMDHVPVRVGEHLHLDVPGILEIPLHVDGGIGEVRLALPGRRLERAVGVARAHATISIPLPPPPAAALMMSG